MLNNPNPLTLIRSLSRGIKGDLLLLLQGLSLAVRRGTTGIRGGFVKSLVEPRAMALSMRCPSVTQRSPWTRLFWRPLIGSPQRTKRRHWTRQSHWEAMSMRGLPVYGGGGRLPENTLCHRCLPPGASTCLGGDRVVHLRGDKPKRISGLRRVTEGQKLPGAFPAAAFAWTSAAY
jgi:hypothetical protein